MVGTSLSPFDAPVHQPVSVNKIHYLLINLVVNVCRQKGPHLLLSPVNILKA